MTLSRPKPIEPDSEKTLKMDLANLERYADRLGYLRLATPGERVMFQFMGDVCPLVTVFRKPNGTRHRHFCRADEILPIADIHGDCITAGELCESLNDRILLLPQSWRVA